MTLLELSIIVVSWNTRDLLEKCIRSVNETAEDLQIEILVVDNASSDGSTSMVRKKFPDVHIVENKENLGFARANNQAFRESRGRYLLLLNSDAELTSGVLNRMLAFMDGNLEVGAVGPKILYPNGSFQSSAMYFPSLLGEFLLATKLSRICISPHFPSRSEGRSKESQEADWLTGACLLIRREALEDVGDLDENYFMYSEEVDWCWRARKNGWKIQYLADAQVIHQGGQSIGQVPVSRRMRVYAGKLLFFKKNRSHIYSGLFKSMIMMITLLKLILTATFLVVPITAIRERATQNLRSYSLLMSNIVRQ